MSTAPTDHILSTTSVMSTAADDNALWTNETNVLAGNISTKSSILVVTKADDNADVWTMLDEVYLILTCIILVIGTVGNMMVIGAVLIHR